MQHQKQGWERALHAARDATAKERKELKEQATRQADTLARKLAEEKANYQRLLEKYRKTSPPLVPQSQPQPRRGTNLLNIARGVSAVAGPLGPIAVSAAEWFFNLF